MDFSDDERAFLRDLVKGSRQRHHHVKWVDRDGSERVTVLSQNEVVRLNTIAGRLKVAKGEVLRQAAHIPVAKPGRADSINCFFALEVEPDVPIG